MSEGDGEPLAERLERCRELSTCEGLATELQGVRVHLSTPDDGWDVQEAVGKRRAGGSRFLPPLGSAPPHPLAPQ